MMKPSLRRAIFAARLTRLAVTGGLCILLAGCGSATIDQGVPVSGGADRPPSGPVNTGTYPNLNIPPKPAAAQITESERRQSEAELKAALSRQSQAAPAGQARDDSAGLRRLGDSHARDTLQAIEGGS